MTRDEIKKAMEWESFNYPQIEIAITRIEKLVNEAAKLEREACAAICENERDEAQTVTGAFRAQECAKRIRERGQQ